jgi:hypothetical protein
MGFVSREQVRVDEFESAYPEPTYIPGQKQKSSRPMAISGLPSKQTSADPAGLSEKCQKRSFGHARYSPGLAQLLDIFEPAKWRAFDPGNAQSGIDLQDCVASATGFGSASGHRQVRH